MSFSYLSDEWTTAFGVINAAVALIAFTGNLLAFLVILKTKHFRNLSTCFLGSLIVTDFLVGILLAPLFVAQLVSAAMRNDCMVNNVRKYLSFLLVGASVSSTALISYDRYLHLAKTQNYGQFMNKRKVTALIIVGWAIPATVPLLAMVGKDDRIFYGITFVFTFLCFVVKVACYLCIVRIVRKRRKRGPIIKLKIKCNSIE